jgi:glyceraldehyde-3-phosphate dehydrogenase (NADP+)
MKMLINGKWVDGISKETIEVCNPATGELIDTVPRGKKEDIDIAVSCALEGYKQNRKISALEKSTYLKRVGQLILRHLEELTELMIRENGKSYTWADFEIRKAAEIFDTLSERAKEPCGRTFPMDAMSGSANQIAFEYRQPRGVVGGIIPFNFPVEMLAYKAGSVLAAGNSIVVKLSEDCPLCCLKIGALLLEAGVPEQAFHFLSGYGEEAGVALVEHENVPVITFTGSSAVGQSIMERSAKYLKHLSLELGGNDPVIVFEDANLDTVANSLIKGRMTVGNGQACVADKRFIVQNKVYEQLLEKCIQVVKKLKVGNPSDHQIDVGPVINEKSAVKIEQMILDDAAKGAKVLLGGKRFNKTFIEPAIVSDVTRDMRLAREECFGPVAPFIRFETEKEALDIANDSCYGLQGAVYTQDISRALRIADDMEVGGVVINASSCFRPGNVPYMPRKMSGIGTDNMYNCYDEMTTGKAVVINNAMDRFNVK